MRDAKTHTALLGFAFLVFLFLASIENSVFFKVLLKDLLKNHVVAVGMLFLHNALVVSLILLGMSFYVSLVRSDFFKREKYSHIVLEHPRAFAAAFTLLTVFLSILRGCVLIYGHVEIEALPAILFISTPIGLVEGYGIYLTIRNTLSQTMKTRDLIHIYSIFLIAAVLEVAFINVLITTLKLTA